MLAKRKVYMKLMVVYGGKVQFDSLHSYLTKNLYAESIKESAFASR